MFCYFLLSGQLVVCRGDVRQGWVSRVDVEHCLKEKGGVRVRDAHFN